MSLKSRLNYVVASKGLTSLHREVLMIYWLSQNGENVPLEVINEHIFPDVISLGKKNIVVKELEEAGLLKDGKVNSDLIELIFKSNNIDKNRNLKYKSKHQHIYDAFEKSFGIHTIPSHPIEHLIGRTNLSDEQIIDAIQFASCEATWLSKHLTKDWFGLPWILTKISDFAVGGKYRKSREEVDSDDKYTVEDFGI